MRRPRWYRSDAFAKRQQSGSDLAASLLERRATEYGCRSGACAKRKQSGSDLAAPLLERRAIEYGYRSDACAKRKQSGSDRYRSGDLTIFSRALYQLSYRAIVAATTENGEALTT